MSKTITCRDCGAKRHNARYSNTLYCKSCRLLRDLLYAEDNRRPCDACKQLFAPVSRRDAYCGRCCMGSIYEGTCAICKTEDAELHRAGVAVCVKCVRDPTKRRFIVSGLRKGQKARREANGHAA